MTTSTAISRMSLRVLSVSPSSTHSGQLGIRADRVTPGSLFARFSARNGYRPLRPAGADGFQPQSVTCGTVFCFSDGG